MPATATYSPTGNAYIDGVLSGTKWGVSSLTFSFPSDKSFYGFGYPNGEPSSNFEAFSDQQQDAVRAILKMYAAVANVTFTEVTESATVHGDLRYAESDKPSTAWAYYPSTAAAGGDAWFNNSKNYYDYPVMGNYAFLTMLHETGHAMGLKHPQDAIGSFGVMPLDHDSLEYTVMSYRSYIGASTTTGYTNGSGSYPQSLMMYDIAALQQEYGANYGTNSGDSVYRWSPTTGQESIDGVAQAMPAGNKVFMTVWDGGGNDTYDLSNYATGVNVNLQPGGWTITSTTQLAVLGSGKYAIGNVANALLYQGNTASLIENAIGGAGNDTLTGNLADNRLTGGAGNDVLDGREAVDTALFSGLASDYSRVQNADGSWTIADLRSGGPDGIDTLRNIEFFQFADSLIASGDTGTTTVQTSSTTETTGTSQTSTSTSSLQSPVTDVAPTAFADSYWIARNGKLSVTGSGVMRNDVDPDGDPLTAVLVSKPSSGTLAFNSDGSFLYTPKKNFVGTVSFTYKDSDGSLSSNTATVTIKVGGSSTTASQLGSAPVTETDIREDQIPASVDWLFPTSETNEESHGTHPDSLLSHLGSGSFEHDHGAWSWDAAETDPGIPDFLRSWFSEFHLT